MRAGASSSAVSFRNFAEILSGPLDLLVLVALRSFSTPDEEMTIISVISGALGWSKLGMY